MQLQKESLRKKFRLVWDSKLWGVYHIFDRKIRFRCEKHNGKLFTNLPQKCHIRYGLNPKKGRICVGKQHSVWFIPTGVKGLPQNVLLNFRLEFPKNDLTIYLPSRISEIFCQMVSTVDLCDTGIIEVKGSNHVQA